MVGTIKWFNAQKGYGFITDEDGAEHFVHVSGVQQGRTYTGFEEGDKVEFNLKDDDKRGDRCVDVVLTDPVKITPKPKKKVNNKKD